MKRHSQFALASRILIGAFSGLFCDITNTAKGLEQPDVHLGTSSFSDGMAGINGERAGHFYFHQDLQYYTATSFRNSQGRAFLGTPNLDVYSSVTQLGYLLDKPRVLWGRIGFQAAVPVVSLNTARNIPFIQANPEVLGDLKVGAGIQWDAITTDSHPIFIHRLNLDVLVPTGSYDQKFLFNPGANFFSLNPSWAGTFVLGGNLVTSWKINYLWNDSNNQPSLARFPPTFSSVQAGQVIHFNFDSAYNLYDQKLFAGVSTYYLNQFTDSRVNGVSVRGLQERVFGIGPEVVFRFSDRLNCVFNVYFESAVLNRSSGTRFNSALAYHF